MDLQSKTPRRRVANFTADEKALLAQLIKNRPIVESKITDGKSIAKKQAAWDLITQEFNCNANRETSTLKRAWDNMKAYTRKARATERGNLIRTGGGPHAPPVPPQQGAIVSLVEEAAPMMIREISNSFDSDGAVLYEIQNIPEPSGSEENVHIDNNAVSIDCFDIDMDTKSEAVPMDKIENDSNPTIMSTPKSIVVPTEKYSAAYEKEKVRKPTDYICREAVIRIKHLENKKKNDMLLFDKQMEVIKKQSENEDIRRRILLYEEEKAKIELENLKKSSSK